jgi:hypothetical protein
MLVLKAACRSAPSAAVPCCIPPATFPSESVPPSASKRSFRVKNSSRNFPLKLSQYPFSHRLPGSMYNILVPSFPSQFRNSPAIYSGPLSERMCSGIPRTNITSAKPLDYLQTPQSPRHATPSTPAYTRRSAPRCAVLVHRASWLSQSRSSTHDLPAPGAVGYTNHHATTTALVAAVCAAPSAPRVGQIRCTRSLPTCHPALFNSTVMRR